MFCEVLIKNMSSGPAEDYIEYKVSIVVNDSIFIGKLLSKNLTIFSSFRFHMILFVQQKFSIEFFGAFIKVIFVIINQYKKLFYKISIAFL